MSLEMDAWHLSPGIPGQHSALTPNFQLLGGHGLAIIVQPLCHVVWLCLVYDMLAGSRWLGNTGSLDLHVPLPPPRKKLSW